MAGYVHELGEEEERKGEWKVGDRVAGFHAIGSEGGAYAEYGVVKGSTIVRLGEGDEGVGFEGMRLCSFVSILAVEVLVGIHDGKPLIYHRSSNNSARHRNSGNRTFPATASARALEFSF